MTYEEYLKSLGATDDDLKILNHAVARKAWEKQQADIAEAQKVAQEAAAKAANYDKWYAEVAEPTGQKLSKERDEALARATTAEANFAAEQARVAKLREAGLIKMAEDQGVKIDDEKKTAAVAGPDLSKYVTTETLMQIADREGDAIAVMADILQEHGELFPGQRITARELRKRALEQKKSVEQVWLDTYKVPEARAKKAETEKKAYEEKLIKEAIEKDRSERMNPNTGIPLPSNNPFTNTVARTGKKQPWEVSDSDKEAARINKVMSKLQAGVQ